MIDVQEFVKLPVEIEAARFVGPFMHDDFLEWIGENARVNYTNDAVGVFEIITLEGVMRVDPGDWVIKGVEGEFYPCKPAIFNKTYRPKVEDTETVTMMADNRPYAKVVINKSEFHRELEELIKKHSMENGSNTPDFILATFLMGVLESCNTAIQARDRWMAI